MPAILSRISEPVNDLVEATPLFYYYVLEGLFAAGADEAALRGMRDRYAPMIESTDVPTVWEFWMPYIRERGANVGHEFGHGELASLTHTGGVGPAWTLSKHVLGVYPVGQGLHKCRIEPHPGYLSWARGVFPSVRGDIEVSWKQEGGRIVLDVGLPDGLEAELTLARDGSQDLQLVHNGRTFDVAAGAQSVPGVELEEKRIAIRVVGGHHHLELAAQ